MSGHALSDAGKPWLSQDFRSAAVPIAAVLRVATRSAPAMMMMWCPAIPWKRGHFPLADSCNFGSSSDYRTPVHF